MAGSNKRSRTVLAVFAAGAMIILTFIKAPFYIPCIWKLAIGLPCPACGLTRAVVLASQLRFVDAIKMNVLFLPLAIGAFAYSLCTLIDLISCKNAAARLNAILGNKWIIMLVAMLALLSWLYNITRGI